MEATNVFFIATNVKQSGWGISYKALYFKVHKKDSLKKSLGLKGSLFLNFQIREQKTL